MQHEMHFEVGTLNVRVQGLFSLKEAKSGFLEVLEAAAQLQAERVLVDGRMIEGAPAFMKRYHYSEFVAEEVRRLLIERKIFPAIRFAYVLVAPIRDPGLFGENVAANRGMVVKTFDTLQGALEWLDASSDAQP
jgi:hypothetical protein